MIFFLVMLIVSSYVFYLSMNTIDRNLSGQDDLVNYAGDTKKALLKCTVSDAWYIDGGGKVVERQDASVLELMLEELLLMEEGVPRDSFLEGYEVKTERIASFLVRDDMHFALSCSYLDSYIFISNTAARENEIPECRAASSLSVQVPNGELTEKASIVFYVWL